MLMVPENQLVIFVDVLRKTGGDITYHPRDHWHSRPVFQGVYMGKLLWGTMEGVVVQVQSDDPDTLNTVKELYSQTVQALAQGEKDGGISEPGRGQESGNDITNRATNNEGVDKRS
jgi:hypothetical protein